MPCKYVINRDTAIVIATDTTLCSSSLKTSTKDNLNSDLTQPNMTNYKKLEHLNKRSKYVVVKLTVGNPKKLCSSSTKKGLKRTKRNEALRYHSWSGN